jgi:hypothetical protein
MTDLIAGDLAVCNIPGAPAAPLIRAGQWLNGDGFGAHVHAFIYLGAGMIAEAAPGGARMRLLADCGYTDIVCSAPTLNPSPQVRARVCEAAKDLLGTPYSAADYFALAAHRLHIPAPHLRAYIASSGHMICSQYADTCALRAGWHLFSDGRWPGDVTPGDLFHLFRPGEG